MLKSAEKLFAILGIFMLTALLFNVPLEMLIPVPEEKTVSGVVRDYVVFNLIGCAVFFLSELTPKRMGILSLLAGMLFMEYLYAKPEWLRDLLGGQFGESVGGMLVSCGWWFITWGLPALIYFQILKPRFG